MTKVKTTTIRAKEEDDANLFINGTVGLDGNLLGSDGESGEEDERAHNNLLNDISKISKKKKLGAAPRSVRTSTKDGGTLVNAKAILKRLGARDLEESTKKLQRLNKPLEKVNLQRLKRAAGYDKVACESEKWASLVHKRRTAEQLTFPLQEADIRVHTTLKTEEIKMRTPLEQEVYSLLQGAKLMEDRKETNEEIARKRAMSLDELKERNRTAWREKQIKRKLERKAWQQNKIKSRKYHRLLKRERIKKQMAELEELEKTNPEAALEKAEELEKLRVHERMTLRHKNSKWARVQGLRASRDELAKTALKDSQIMHQDLVTKRKIAQDSSDEDEDEVEEKLEALRREREKAIGAGLFDPSNPWTANLFRKIPEKDEKNFGNPIDDSFVNFKKFWNEVNKRRLMEKKAREELAKREEEARQNERENSKEEATSDEEEEGLEEDDANVEMEDSNYDEMKAQDTCDLTNASGGNDDDGMSNRGDEEVTDEDGDREKKDKKKVKPSKGDVKEKKKKTLESKKKNLSKVKVKGKKKLLLSDSSKVLGSKISKKKGEQSIKKKAAKKKINEKDCLVKEGKKNKGKRCTNKEDTAKKKKNKDDISKKGKKKNSEKKQKVGTQKKNKKLVLGKKEENNDGEKVVDNGEEESIVDDDLEDQLVSIDNLFNQAELKLKKKLKKKLEKIGIKDGSDRKWTKVGSKKAVKQMKKKQKKGDENDKRMLPKVEEFDFTVKKDQENTNEGLERARTMEDMDNLQQEKEENYLPFQKAAKILQAGEEKGDEKTTSASGGKTSSKPGKMVQLDPTKFLQVDNKLLQTSMPNTISSGMDGLDDDEDEDDPDDVIQQAFADDYLIDEFQAEKKAAIDKDKPKGLCLVLPGWGDWTGPNIKVSKRKRKKFTVKPLPEAPRKDATMGNVIYNEKADIHDNLRKVLVSELPYPFSRVKDFEASVRAPVGRMFVPEKEHRKLTAPPVITKSGTIIEAMTEEQLLKYKNSANKNMKNEEPPPKRRRRNKKSKLNSK